MPYPMWNQSRAGIIVDRGNGVLAFLESGSEFESLKGSAADWHQAPEPPRVYTEADFETAIQRHIDATARQRLYRDGSTCASYFNSTVPLWAAEAGAFIAWRDAVWLAVLDGLESVQSGKTPMPVLQDIIEALPVIEWPEGYSE